MPEETNDPTTEYLNVRGLPTWAADAIRARASKTGVTFSAMVRIILADTAMRYESEAPTAQPAPVAEGV